MVWFLHRTSTYTPSLRCLRHVCTHCMFAMYTANPCIHINIALIFQPSASGPGGKEGFHGLCYSKTSPPILTFGVDESACFSHKYAVGLP